MKKLEIKLFAVASLPTNVKMLSFKWTVQQTRVYLSTNERTLTKTLKMDDLCTPIVT